MICKGPDLCQNDSTALSSPPQRCIAALACMCRQNPGVRVMTGDTPPLRVHWALFFGPLFPVMCQLRYSPLGNYNSIGAHQGQEFISADIRVVRNIRKIIALTQPIHWTVLWPYSSLDNSARADKLHTSVPTAGASEEEMNHALRMQLKSHRPKKILIHLHMYMCMLRIFQLRFNQILQTNKNTPNLVEFNSRQHSADTACDYKLKKQYHVT